VSISIVEILNSLQKAEPVIEAAVPVLKWAYGLVTNAMSGVKLSAEQVQDDLEKAISESKAALAKVVETEKREDEETQKQIDLWREKAKADDSSVLTGPPVPGVPE